MFDLSQFFNAYVMTIPRGRGRLARFKHRAKKLGITGIEEHMGADGLLIKPPRWWRSSRTSFAINLNMTNLLHKGIMTQNGKPILMFEEDAWLKDDFEVMIQEVIHFMDQPDFKVCYLGGKRHRIGEKVGRFLHKGAKITGTYGVVFNFDHAINVAGYLLAPPAHKTRNRHAYHNDVLMRHRCNTEIHHCLYPPAVGHMAGPSMNRKKKGAGRDLKPTAQYDK